MMQKITPFLWYDSQAEEAASFYVSIFKNSKVGNVTRYEEASSKASGQPAGSVMTVDFQLDGQSFVALNGGPTFKLNEAVSFVINCATQEEIDYFWEKLTADGGQEVECGWLKDKFGLSWQVVPVELTDLIKKSDKVLPALLQMKKLDISELKRAAGETA
jgi:predicted 3-demethylubiquinone-9 3-methyltransferase (glyoxalase superfamily)